MSHLDEGTLHALLDGELGAAELMQIEAHLGTCAACGSRLRDAREFLSEADRLVGTVQFNARPASAPAPTRTPPPPAAPTPRHEERPWEDEGSPVLLIPDNPEATPFARRWPRVLGLAATVAVAVGAGYMASRIARPSDSDVVTTLPSVAARGDTQPVVSAAETNRPSAPPGRDSGSTPAPAIAGALKAPANTASAAPSSLGQTRAQLKPAPSPKPAKTTVAARQPAPTPPVDTAEEADRSEEAATKAAEQEAIRLQAASALSQLDRERRVSRAAAATARLDQAELERNQTVAPPPAAPPPPTLEQRAQIYLRIGLDEANRQLGGPVHVIEGMSPTLMGLAPGRVAAAADTTRPVVRVVYQDGQGRMIVLDQQRRSGQASPPPTSGAWSVGDVNVALSGDVPAGVLRSLRTRVR